jgi:hypothetical protein
MRINFPRKGTKLLRGTVATIAEITQGSLLLGENLFSDKKLPLSING